MILSSKNGNKFLAQNYENKGFYNIFKIFLFLETLLSSGFGLNAGRRD